jgi:hypothetical protein
MKSLEARFRDIEIKNPTWSTFVVFVSAIYQAGFTEKVIRQWFNKLVDKDDYSRSEKDALMKWIVKQSTK